MQSVGEVMAIGRTFPESLQKAMRSLEQGRAGLNCDAAEQQFDQIDTAALMIQAGIGTPDRIFQVESLLRRGVSVEDVFQATKIDRWFLDQILMLCEERSTLESHKTSGSTAPETGVEQSSLVLEMRSWRTSGT
jgi:carbamoyl-phosphate synthase large subunit